MLWQRDHDIAPGARPCRAPYRGRGAPAGRPRYAKLSACATCQAAHRAKARRRDGDIAPYRDGARAVRTAAGHEGVRDAKQRTAPRRGGAMGTSRPTATGHERCARQREAGCQAAHRSGAAARWGHRALPRRGTRGAHSDGARAVRTATGHGRCARRRARDVRAATGCGARGAVKIILSEFGFSCSMDLSF